MCLLYLFMCLFDCFSKQKSLNPEQTIRVKFTDVVHRTVETCREFHSKIQNISDDEM